MTRPLVLGLALLVAACGADGDPERPDPRPRSSAAPSSGPVAGGSGANQAATTAKDGYLVSWYLD